MAQYSALQDEEETCGEPRLPVTYVQEMAASRAWPCSLQPTLIFFTDPWPGPLLPAGLINPRECVVEKGQQAFFFFFFFFQRRKG